MLTVILALLVAALAAPIACRLARGWSGALLALAPGVAFVFFARQVGAIAQGAVAEERTAWAPELGLSLSFRLDGLGLLFALLITGVGALVVLYAGSYLAGNPGLGRFYLFLLAFMASMLGVVLAGNLLLLFIFWELTSISSYALIGFQHEREQARKSALQGLLVTVGGGQALLAGLLLLGHMGQSLEVSVLLGQGPAVRGHALYLPCLLLLLLGAFTKSAQVPFQSWLPGAMEAPTPVSAYLHSATMVKAGVYLLMRLTPALGGTGPWWLLLTCFGGVTMLWGSVLALKQTDLKRLLAYATLGVLGLLVLLLGVGTPGAIQAALTFLAGHALYKGALFLVAGIVDHGTGTRDVTRLGGLRRHMPFTAGAAVLAALAMAGVMPAFAFIGKELVYEAALGASRAPGLLSASMVLAFVPMVAVAGMVGVRPFFGALGNPPHAPHEAPAALWLGPAVLAVLGLVLGLVPGVLEPLLTAAAASIQGPTRLASLGLWHGVNPALGLSVLSLAAGAAVFTWRERLRGLLEALPFAKLPPAWAFQRALSGMLSFADLQTRLLQPGSLGRYLLVTLLATFGLLAYALWRFGGPLPAVALGDARPHELGVAVLTVAAAVAAVRSSSRLASVAALGVVGFGVALLFLFFGAPDLALTQAIVEALTVVIFLLALFRLPRYADLSSRAVRLRDLALSLSAGALMTALVLLVEQRASHASISGYYSENSVPLARGHNIVNVILTDFRALDTLGEITVLAVAGLGVHALVKLRLSPGPRP